MNVLNELMWLRVFVCAMLAHVSSLTNNTLTSSEAVSIIKNAGLLHMYCGLALVFKGLSLVWMVYWVV